jgi:hypothetical protein
MISIIYGGITHHYLASNLPYCSRINNNSFGTIHNEYVIGMVGSENFKLGVLSGKDSACGNILGPIMAAKVSENVDFMLGGYNTNIKEFHNLGIEPPSFNGYTPIIGFDFKLNLYDGESYKINIDNLVSLGIITHAISINF